MRRPVCWIVITLFLCLLTCYASAGGGYGGASSPITHDYSSGQYSESPVQNDASSSAASADPGSYEYSEETPGSNTGNHGTGGSDGTNGDQESAPVENDGPANGVTESGLGNAGFSSDDYEPSTGNSWYAEAGSGSMSGTGTAGKGGESSPLVDSGSGEGLKLQNRAGEGTGSPQTPGSFIGSEGGRDAENSAGRNRQATSLEEHGGISAQEDRQGSIGMVASFAGSAGMMRSGSRGSMDPSSTGQSPQVPYAHRQQGMPEQSGHHPCGPAETSPVTPAKESKETDIKEESHARPRSKRARTFVVEENADRLPANPTPSSRIPLFPFSLLLFGGYRRISKKNVLEQNTRNLIYHAISSYPGIDVPTLVRKTGINENTLRYHLVKIIESGRITYLIKPGVIRYFLNQGSFSLPEQVLIHYLWGQTPRNIIGLLDNSPGMTRQQISEALKISGPSVTRQMEHLIEDRIIENRFPGRSNHYYLTEEIRWIFKRVISQSPGATEYGDSRHSIPVLADGLIPEPPALY